MRLLVILLLAAVAVSATELDFGLGAGPVALPTYMAAGRPGPFAAPYALRVGVDLPVSGQFSIALRGIFVGGYHSWDEQLTEREREQTVVLGGRGQAAFLGRVPVIGRLWVQGGIGLGYDYYRIENREEYGITGSNVRAEETDIHGAVQTFLLGGGLRVNSRVNIAVEAELLGMRYLRERYRLYARQPQFGEILLEAREQNYTPWEAGAQVPAGGMLFGVSFDI